MPPLQTTLFPGVALVIGAGSGIDRPIPHTIYYIATCATQNWQWGKGIGQATAVSFVKEGCRKISIADRNASGLAETKRLIEEEVRSSLEQIDIVTRKTDVTQEAEIEELIVETTREFGRIDYAVNCAGKIICEKAVVMEGELVVNDDGNCSFF